MIQQVSLKNWHPKLLKMSQHKRLIFFKFRLHDVINAVSMLYHLVQLQLFLWLFNSADSTADNLADIVSKVIAVKYIAVH